MSLLSSAPARRLRERAVWYASAVPADAPTDRVLAGLQREWDELAQTDALWAVLTDPARKGGRWTVEEFLAAGETEIEAVLERTAALGGPARRGRALDFGCGAGRLTRALSLRFDEAVGVDVSPEMVRRARELNGDRDNVELVVNAAPDLAFLPSRSFDLAYSNIVLQHLPSSDLAASFARELLRVTAPDGVAVFQAPDAIPLRFRLQPLRRAYAGLRRLGVPARALILRTPLQPMRMTPLPRARVEALVADAGADLLAVEPDGAFGFRYYATGAAAAS
jgi:SAM-dependent methyltransferase